MLAVVLDLTRTLRVLVDAGEFKQGDYRLLHWTLPILCIATAMVGLFPTTVNPVSDFLHNLAANGMVVLFVILMFIVPRRIRIYPLAFLQISWAMGFFSIALFVLHFGSNAINFVTLELLLLPVCGAWLILLRHFTLVFVRTKSNILFASTSPDNPLIEPLQNALFAYSRRVPASHQRVVLASDDGRNCSVRELERPGINPIERLVARIEEQRILILKEDTSDPLIPVLGQSGVPVDRVAEPARAG